MRRNWLWDRRLTDSEVKEILGNPDHPKFILVSSLLLARSNNPKEIFGEYIEAQVFCENWAGIKKRMRMDKWNDPRIVFWQAVYDRLLEKYREKGIIFRHRKRVAKFPICEGVGQEIQNIRKKQNLSQRDLAKKIGVSQQLISRIESGEENISLLTLSKVSKVLGKKIKIILQ